MKVSLDAIELDTSIQCRAAIDTALVGEYGSEMYAGTQFPPIEVYGTKEKCWLGDGWHRVLAARQIGQEEIEATLHPGGRADALKHALGANALHGHRRTTADKRRCVALALAEFPKLSSRAVAKLCGVHHETVEAARPIQLADSASSTRVGLDGKERPAARRVAPEPQAKDDPARPEWQEIPRNGLGPPRDGMQYAWIAVKNLESIREDDLERDAAFRHVREWLAAHWKEGEGQ